MRNFVTKHTSNGTTYYNAYVIADHYNHSLKSFKELVAVLKAAFPEVNDMNVHCTTVSKSGWCHRCPIVRYHIGHTLPACDWNVCNFSDLDVEMAS